MKKIFLFTLAVFTSTFCLGQGEGETGSLIADIMNVAPVTQTMDETTVEADTEYKEVLEEKKSDLEATLSKQGEQFKEDVGDVIEQFNKVLEKGVEQDVNVEKKRVITKVNTLSMNLLKNKKKTLMDFNGTVTQSIRKLPKLLVEEKEQELKDIISEYKEKFDVEYAANQGVIEGFKSTVHLIKSEEGSAAKSEDQ